MGGGAFADDAGVGRALAATSSKRLAGSDSDACRAIDRLDGALPSVVPILGHGSAAEEWPHALALQDLVVGDTSVQKDVSCLDGALPGPGHVLGGRITEMQQGLLLDVPSKLAYLSL